MNPPSAAIEVTQQSIMTGDESRAYAKELAESKMISPYFRGSIPNVLYAMELGRVYGLEAATVLQNIHVFPDGKGNLKAATSAHLMVTLARRAGHIVTTSANPKGATCTIVRGESLFGKMLKGNVTPEELAHYSSILTTLKDLEIDAKELGFSQIRWNTEMAIRAELLGKDNWIKYPHAMFASAAKRDCVRLTCEEVLIQLADRSSQAMNMHGPLSADGQPVEVAWSHTADELGASIADDGEEVSLSAQQRHTSQAPEASRSAEAPREQVTVTRLEPEMLKKTAQADIAAQAAANPSQAGWHQSAQSPKPAESQPNEAIKNFVTGKSPEDIAVWTRQTVSSEDMDEETKVQRIDLVMSLLTQHCDIDKVGAVVTCISSLDGLDPKQKVDLIGPLHRAAKSAGLLKNPVEGAESLNALIVEIVRPLMAAAGS